LEGTQAASGKKTSEAAIIPMPENDQDGEDREGGQKEKRCAPGVSAGRTALATKLKGWGKTRSLMGEKSGRKDKKDNAQTEDAGQIE